MIALVRESGGVGDVICCGAAARALKLDRPDCMIGLFIPDDFCDIGARLDGVDEVVGLGKLVDLQNCRRGRDHPLDPEKYPYLRVVYVWHPEIVVDLYCPGFRHELTSPEPRLSRAQAFAMAAGARRCLDARARWRPLPGDEAILDKYQGLDTPRPWVAYQPRATCRARSLGPEQAVALASLLRDVGVGTLWWLDCVLPPSGATDVATALVNATWANVAAVVGRCAAVVAVDSAIVHLAAALDVPCLGLFGPTFGGAVTASYPKCRPIEGHSTACPAPCHYSQARKWDPTKCRAEGCSRIAALDFSLVMSGLGQILEGGP